MLKTMYESLDTLEDLYELIDTAIVDDPPITVMEGGIIKKGYIPEIDELIDITTNGKNWLLEIEQTERELTGIKNLKSGYNKVFGYYIEVTKSFLKMVPQDRYIRKQTLTGAERYITEKLKNKENEIVGAREKIIKLEYDAFVGIRNKSMIGMYCTDQTTYISRNAIIAVILFAIYSSCIVAAIYNQGIQRVIYYIISTYCSKTSNKATHRTAVRTVENRTFVMGIRN